MITSFRHDRTRKRKRDALKFIIAFVLILIFTWNPLSRFFSSVFHAIGTPIWGAKSSLLDFVDNSFAAIRFKQSLAEENNHLRDVINTMALESYERDALRRENETLKEMLGRHKEGELLLARVLASPAQSPFDTLIIDAGEEQGVGQGMHVLSDGDFVIGEVTSVFGRSAIVTLYSSPGNTVDATVGTSSIPVTLIGSGGGNFRFTLPRGIELVVGDMVDIPSLGSQYAGTIDGINRPEGSSLQSVHVKMPVNIYQIRWVYVVAPFYPKNAENDH